jgi:hypothetical protein
MSDGMNRIPKLIILLALVLAVTSEAVKDKGEAATTQPVLTHADAAVVLAKYSGFFDRYVEADASLNDCVAFLNGVGIYFGLMEVVNKSEFTEKDFARVMGQIKLVLRGEAEYDGGKVKLPNEFATWEEFCTINDINFAANYQAMLGSFRLILHKKGE